jgi:prolyl-tRNA synthetase
MTDFVIGANKNDYHFTGANFERDFPKPQFVDLRNVTDGDPSPDGKGSLELCRGIEVGHIFQLRTKYSEAMNLSYLDEAGKKQIIEMGCYGIGVTRIVAAAIEQNHDEHGLTIPAPIAPFTVVLIPIGYHKNELVRTAADALYQQLSAAGIDTLIDDRNERPGAMFADMDLIGVPHRFVIGERGLKEQRIEYKGRRDTQAQELPIAEVMTFIQSKQCAD